MDLKERLKKMSREKMYWTEHDLRPPTGLAQRIEHLEEKRKEVGQRWAEAQRVFKELDFEYGRLLCSLQDLKRKKFEKERGITKCAPAGEPRKRVAKSEPSLTERVKNMTVEQVAQLIKELKQQTEGEE